MTAIYPQIFSVSFAPTKYRYTILYSIQYYYAIMYFIVPLIKPTTVTRCYGSSHQILTLFNIWLFTAHYSVFICNFIIFKGICAVLIVMCLKFLHRAVHTINNMAVDRLLTWSITKQCHIPQLCSFISCQHFITIQHHSCWRPLI